MNGYTVIHGGMLCIINISRYCANPFPVHGVKECEGEGQEVGPCEKMKPCPGKRKEILYLYLPKETLTFLSVS